MTVASGNSALGEFHNHNYCASVPTDRTISDASNFSPARVPTAFTVGPTSIADVVPSGANYGSVLDIYGALQLQSPNLSLNDR